MKFWNEKVDENTNYERDFTDDKIKTLAYHINKRLNTMENNISSLAAAINIHDAGGLTKRLDAVVEEDGKQDAALTKNLEDLDFKFSTVISYNEHLLYNLKSGLHDALSLIGKDMKSVWWWLDSCISCNDKSKDESTLLQHTHNHHHFNIFPAEIVGMLSEPRMTCAITLHRIIAQR